MANGDIRDVMGPMRIHQAVKVTSLGGAAVFGRVWGFEGAAMDGIHACVVVRTPHASTIRVGRIWVAPISSKEELDTLYAFEATAKAEGRWYSDGPEE